MEIEIFKSTLKDSIDQFIENELYLIENNANERSISFQLARYLSLNENLSTYHIDCEYNRKGDEVKRLPQSSESNTDDTRGKTIFPDIIIHKRGNDSSNLAIIEIKKDNNNDTDRDIEKLENLTSHYYDYNYIYGIHLTFNTTQLGEYKAELYQGGRSREENLFT